MHFALLFWVAFVLFAPHAYDRTMLWQADTTTVKVYETAGGVMGSGVVLGRRDTAAGCLLLVATARHVISAEGAVVTLAEPTGPVARVVSLAPDFDTAAAEFLLPGLCDALPYRAAALSGTPVVRGEKVFGSGYPGGTRFFGWGLVTDTHVDVSIEGGKYRLIAANYTAGPGHSGGPLYDGYGDVVGLLIATSVSTPSLAVFAPADQVRVALRLIPGWEN